jgi:cytochrome b
MVQIWSPLIRLFHWGLAILVISNLFNEAGDKTHRTFGYIAFGLIVFRLGYGFIGKDYANFKTWPIRPSQLTLYLKNFPTSHSTRYVGHNPLGALMMVVMLTLVATLGITGYLGRETEIFLFNETLENIHTVAGNLMYACIAFHILGALVSSFKHKENLIGAMVHGKKRESRNKEQK